MVTLNLLKWFGVTYGLCKYDLIKEVMVVIESRVENIVLCAQTS